MLSQILSLVLALLLVSLVAATNSQKKLVTDLPGSSSVNDVSYAGYVTIDASEDANLFYWFFPSRKNPETAPVVLWMTGGPGCSSELAVLFENGPFSVDENLNLVENPYSWSEVANVIYIDQPYGAGFSYTRGTGVKNEAQMADDMYIFLKLWLTEVFPEYAQNEFFITGESFAGHYIPVLSSKIIQENSASSSFQINLKGSAIGNGWVDPYVQYGSYAPYGYSEKLIDEREYAKLNQTYEQCKSLLDADKYTSAYIVCSEIMEGVLQQAGNINIYNIDLPCTVPGLCYNFTLQTDYMNLAATQKALGVSKRWETCSNSQITTEDNISSFRDDLPTVLSAGKRVLIYNGMLDLICNYIGGYQWAYGMPWEYESQFQAAPVTDMSYEGAVLGHKKTSHNFTFVAVEQAGHMVPHDQPGFALDLITKFLQNQL